MDVTLIVKASNQQCEDLTIKCEPSWTIRRLKGHLTEVYPGKPSLDEQKLIYSGQLLGDSVVLKDVLRKYDGQQAHTVHLVFTPKNSYYGGNGYGSSSSSSANKTNRNSSGSSSSSSSTSGGNMATNSNVSGTANAAGNARSSGATGSGGASRATGDGAGGDGVRQHTLLQTRPALRTLPGPPPFMEQTAAMQSLVQQTYFQYLNQYINLINEQGGANALYSATGMPQPAATPMNPLTGSPLVASVPFVPVMQPTAPMVGGFPNYAYYPCMTPPGGSSHLGGLPTAGSIPTAVDGGAAAAAGSVSGFPVIPGATPGPGFLPSSPAIPSTSGTQQNTASTSHLVTGSAAPTLPSSGDAGASASTSSTVAAAATEQAPGSQEDTAAAAAPQQDGGAGAEAAAPARARRFPNIVVEEQENNDWLDVFFSVCRVGILITVIYLYSSPMRCLTVLFIGVVLYLKKHLDRVYQAIDLRLTTRPPQEGNAAAQQQPQPPVGQGNNVVPPDQQAAHQVPPQRQEQQPTQRGGMLAEEQPAVAGTSAASSSATKTTDRPATENEAAGGSSSTTTPAQSAAPGLRLRTNAVRSAEAEANAETEPLLERPVVPATGSGTTPAEQPAVEGQRMTFNDMTSFLGALVITFFTSIIPDTPAA